MGGSGESGADATAELWAPTPPAPFSLSVTPSTASIQVGDTRAFSVIDSNGFPRGDATWSVSNPLLATTAVDGGVLLVTGAAVGTVTVTAQIGSVSGQATVTIDAYGPTPTGTVWWQVPYMPAFAPLQLTQARPSRNGPNVYSIQANGAQSVVQAFGAEGQQMWQTHLPAVSANSVPDAHGGIIVTQYNTCTPGQTEPMRIKALDAETGIWRWEITSAPIFLNPTTPLFCYPEAPQMAVRADGSVVIVTPGNTSGLPSLMIVQGLTGQVGQIPIPQSSYQDAGGNINMGYSPIGPPTVDANGNTYVLYEVRTIAHPPMITSATLYLLKIRSDRRADDDSGGRDDQ